MSTDIDRIVISLESLNEIWARIIEIAVGILLLEKQLGWVCLFPILIVMGNEISAFVEVSRDC